MAFMSKYINNLKKAESERRSALRETRKLEKIQIYLDAIETANARNKYADATHVEREACSCSEPDLTNNKNWQVPLCNQCGLIVINTNNVRTECNCALNSATRKRSKVVSNEAGKTFCSVCGLAKG